MPNSLDDFPAVSRTSTEDVLRAMPLPIAVVGNGPIGKPYGELIDSHATVIRFNNFRLRGHEASAGTKVTHWCQNGVVDQWSFRSRWLRWAVNIAFPKRPVGIKPNPHVDASTPCFCPRAFDWQLVESCRKFFDLELHCVADAKLLYPLQAVIPFPTIGFATLYLLLRFQPQVNVFGFNGLANGHYWNRSHRHSRRHLSTAGRELELIRATSRIQFHE